MNKKSFGAVIYDVIFSKLRLYDLIMKLSDKGLRSYRHKILLELNVKENDCLLEANVGNGENLSVLKELYGDSFKFYGIDLSNGMISSTRRRANKEGWRNVELISGDAENLTRYYKEDYFDKIICINGANFYQFREKTLDKMVDTLKSGGKLLIADLYLPMDSFGLSKCLGNILSKAYSVSGFNLRTPVITPKGTSELVSRNFNYKCGLSPYYKIFKKD